MKEVKIVLFCVLSTTLTACGLWGDSTPKPTEATTVTEQNSEADQTGPVIIPIEEQTPSSDETTAQGAETNKKTGPDKMADATTTTPKPADTTETDTSAEETASTAAETTPTPAEETTAEMADTTTPKPADTDTTVTEATPTPAADDTGKTQDATPAMQHSGVTTSFPTTAEALAKQNEDPKTPWVRPSGPVIEITETPPEGETAQITDPDALTKRLEDSILKNQILAITRRCSKTTTKGADFKHCYEEKITKVIAEKCVTIRQTESISQKDCEDSLYKIVMNPDPMFPGSTEADTTETATTPGETDQTTTKPDAAAGTAKTDEPTEKKAGDTATAETDTAVPKADTTAAQTADTDTADTKSDEAPEHPAYGTFTTADTTGTETTPAVPTEADTTTTAQTADDADASTSDETAQQTTDADTSADDTTQTADAGNGEATEETAGAEIAETEIGTDISAESIPDPVDDHIIDDEQVCYFKDDYLRGGLNYAGPNIIISGALTFASSDSFNVVPAILNPHKNQESFFASIVNSFTSSGDFQQANIGELENNVLSFTYSYLMEGDYGAWCESSDSESCQVTVKYYGKEIIQTAVSTFQSKGPLSANIYFNGRILDFTNCE